MLSLLQQFRNKSQYSFTSILLTLFFVTSIFSCTQKKKKQTSPAVPVDSAIEETIRTQLNATTAIPADRINISSTDGIVAMNGYTSNLLAKKRATEIAQATSGVISVINNLRITANRPDDAIQKDVYRALRTDPATENWEITVEVNNGLVRLTGAVDSWQEKKLTSTITAGVKGVTEVKNNIIVSHKKEDRKPADIKAEIKSTLMYDSQIRDNMINVKVDSSVVTLSGSVGSAAEKQLAIEKSHVTGVKKVKAENLKVQPEYNSKQLVNKMVGSLSPSQIEKAIEKTYTYDPRVPADKINVEVEDSTAILTGTVLNLNSKLAATDNAFNTVGIEEVDNRIKVERKVVVRPKVPTTDKAIKSRIIEGVRRDPYVEEAQISVLVDDGVVELQGDVNSQFEKQQIQDITEKVKGVINIVNNLKVKSNNSSGS